MKGLLDVLGVEIDLLGIWLWALRNEWIISILFEWKLEFDETGIVVKFSQLFFELDAVAQLVVVSAHRMSIIAQSGFQQKKPALF